MDKESYLSILMEKSTNKFRLSKRKDLNEIFIKPADIERMLPGKERDIQILRLSIIAELDASNLYEKLALLSSDEKVAIVLRDISQEEKVHAGEFESLIEEIDPEHEEAKEEGKEEVEDLVGI